MDEICHSVQTTVPEAFLLGAPYSFLVGSQRRELTYPASATVDTSHTIPCFFFIRTLWGLHHHAHFTDEQTGVVSGCGVLKFPQLGKWLHGEGHLGLCGSEAEIFAE